MITPPFKERIIREIGKQYTRKIIARLNAEGIVNADGNPYSPDSVRKIVDGRENLEVEAVILKLLKELERKRKKIEAAA